MKVLTAKMFNDRYKKLNDNLKLRKEELMATQEKIKALETEIENLENDFIISQFKASGKTIHDLISEGTENIDSNSFPPKKSENETASISIANNQMNTQKGI